MAESSLNPWFTNGNLAPPSNDGASVRFPNAGFHRPSPPGTAATSGLLPTPPGNATNHHYNGPQYENYCPPNYWPKQQNPSMMFGYTNFATSYRNPAPALPNAAPDIWRHPAALLQNQQQNRFAAAPSPVQKKPIPISMVVKSSKKSPSPKKKKHPLKSEKVQKSSSAKTPTKKTPTDAADNTNASETLPQVANGGSKSPNDPPTASSSTLSKRQRRKLKTLTMKNATTASTTTKRSAANKDDSVPLNDSSSSKNTSPKASPSSDVVSSASATKNGGKKKSETAVLSPPDVSSSQFLEPCEPSVPSSTTNENSAMNNYDESTTNSIIQCKFCGLLRQTKNRLLIHYYTFHPAQYYQDQQQLLGVEKNGQLVSTLSAAVLSRLLNGNDHADEAASSTSKQRRQAASSSKDSSSNLLPPTTSADSSSSSSRSQHINHPIKKGDKPELPIPPKVAIVQEVDGSLLRSKVAEEKQKEDGVILKGHSAAGDQTFKIKPVDCSLTTLTEVLKPVSSASEEEETTSEARTAAIVTDVKDSEQEEEAISRTVQNSPVKVLSEMPQSNDPPESRPSDPPEPPPNDPPEPPPDHPPEPLLNHRSKPSPNHRSEEPSGVGPPNPKRRRKESIERDQQSETVGNWRNELYAFEPEPPSASKSALLPTPSKSASNIISSSESSTTTLKRPLNSQTRLIKNETSNTYAYPKNDPGKVINAQPPVIKQEIPATEMFNTRDQCQLYEILFRKMAIQGASAQIMARLVPQILPNPNLRGMTGEIVRLLTELGPVHVGRSIDAILKFCRKDTIALFNGSTIIGHLRAKY